jgi:hypothetical protein
MQLVLSASQLGVNPDAQAQCLNFQGFPDGGLVQNNNGFPLITCSICFEYEDEQGNDCSTVTLAA